MPAQYWRADGGIQDAPEPEQNDPALASPSNTPCSRLWRPCNWFRSEEQPDNTNTDGNMNTFSFSPPPFGPWFGGGQQNVPAWLQAPVPLGGMYPHPPSYSFAQQNIPMPYWQSPQWQWPYGAPPPPPPPPPVEDPNQTVKPRDKKEKKRKNQNTPPTLPPGTNYMFDTAHTRLHVFNKTTAVWEASCRGQKLRFKVYMVGVHFTVKLLIENVLAERGQEAKGWAVTEVVERGGGRWSKGTTIEYDANKSDGTLDSMGWSKKCGETLPPVWLVIHQVEKK